VSYLTGGDALQPLQVLFDDPLSAWPVRYHRQAAGLIHIHARGPLIIQHQLQWLNVLESAVRSAARLGVVRAGQGN